MEGGRGLLGSPPEVWSENPICVHNLRQSENYGNGLTLVNEAGTQIFRKFVLNESCLYDGTLMPETSEKESINRLAHLLCLN